MPPKKTKATFLIPCLNEARSLPSLLEECEKTFSADPINTWSILVADNGSVDESTKIAEKAGAKVISIQKKGYGSAVHSGIIQSETEWVVYADADGTYCPKDAITLLNTAVRENADMVIGSRLRGTVKPSAMPWLHRYFGTPVLSFLIRLLYDLEISDCNSGIRCIRTDSYTRWKVKSRGMEFASALLIKAANSNALILEVPVTLRRCKKERVPHLRKWQDGMKHLLVILAGAPWLFWKTGITLICFSLMLTIPAFWGMRKILGQFYIFGPHTIALSTIIGCHGAVLLNLALILQAQLPKRKSDARLIDKLLQIPEGVLFWSLVSFIGIFIIGTIFLIHRWSKVDFGELDYIQFPLLFVYFCVIPVTLVIGIFQAHLVRRTDV